MNKIIELMTPVTEKYPENDQEVIGLTTRNDLVAAIFKCYKGRVWDAKTETVIDQDINQFQVQKYPGQFDRSIVTYWTEGYITHWMPANINEEESCLTN